MAKQAFIWLEFLNPTAGHRSEELPSLRRGGRLELLPGAVKDAFSGSLHMRTCLIPGDRPGAIVRSRPVPAVPASSPDICYAVVVVRSGDRIAFWLSRARF